MLPGLLLSADVILFFTAVKLTAVVNATTIGALQPWSSRAFAARLFGNASDQPRDRRRRDRDHGRGSDRDAVGRDAGMERLG